MKDKLLCIYRGTSTQVEMVKNFLEEEGIPVLAKDLTLNQVAPFLADEASLWVTEENEERANQLLSEI